MLTKKVMVPLFLFLFLGFFIFAYGQEQPPTYMTPSEFHELEWQAKVRHFQLLKELDQSRVQQQ